MKYRLKTLKVIILGTILLCTVALLYINIFLAPVKLKNFLTEKFSQATNRPVSLESVHFSLIRGFILKGLTIYEPDQKTVFMKVEKLSTTLLFVPLIKERKIIIPSIHINSPLLNIAKTKGNVWNFSSLPFLVKKSDSKKPKKLDFSVLVQKIMFEGGQINFLDHTRSPVYTKRLVNFEGDAAISLNSLVQFRATSQLDTPLKTSIALSGSYAEEENLLAVKAVLKNLSLFEPYNYFYKVAVFSDLKDGLADASIDLKVYNGKNAALDVNASTENLHISSSGYTLKGDIDIEGSSVFDLTNILKGNHKVQLDLKGSTLSGIPSLNEISNLAGKLTISNKGVHCKYIWGEIYNTPVRFSGGIDDFKRLEANVDIQADLDLVNYKTFLPENLKKKFNTVDLEGLAEVNVSFFDNLKDPQPVSIKGSVQLKDVMLKTAIIPKEVKGISGNIWFRNDLLFVSKLLFNYDKQHYTADAKITNFSSPDIRIKMYNEETLLNSRFQILEDRVRILRAFGNYWNSSFDIGGDIIKLKEPDVLMKGTVSLNLLDFRKAFPETLKYLSKYDVQGICNLDVSISGPLKEPKDFEAAIKAESDRITVKSVKFDEVKMGLTLKDRNLLISKLSARPYGGTFSSTLQMDLKQEDPPYAIHLSLEDFDLAKLAVDTKAKDKPISGKAMSKFEIYGHGKNPETITGKGNLFIKGGYLWELPLLKGLANILHLSDLSSIVFNEVTADFTIADKNVATSNLVLKAKNVELLAKGGVNFDGIVDFFITTKISENYMKVNSEFARFANVLLAKAGQFIGNIRVSGTIKNPKFELMPPPLDEVLKEGFKKLLGGFF